MHVKDCASQASQVSRTFLFANQDDLPSKIPFDSVHALYFPRAIRPVKAYKNPLIHSITNVAAKATDTT